MNNSELEKIAAAADQLVVNHRRGQYHKPVALIWAIDRATQGLPRLATAATVRAYLDAPLKYLSGVDSNAAWPWLKLANDLGSAWSVDGADPAADPPTDFVAGWSRTAYLVLVENPDDAQQLIDALLDKYFRDADLAVIDALWNAASHGVHTKAREWARDHLDLIEREGDDRLWDSEGRSYKVKGRTGRSDQLRTSFDLGHGHEPFDFLVGVVFDSEGELLRAFKTGHETFERLARRSHGTVRFRMSRQGQEIDAVDWLVGP